MHVIQGMYSNARSCVWVNCQYSEVFGVGNGMHQGSVLSPLLFLLKLEAFLREFYTCVPWELLYTDDLVLIADTQEECIPKLKAWKAGMECKGLRVIMKKTKVLVSGVSDDVRKKYGKYPCAVFCSDVSKNSVQCSQRTLWVHKRYRGITKRLWWPTQTMSAAGVMARLSPPMAELCLKWMSTAPCWMWRPLFAT